ncbi:hypothetical protein AWC38_SpisGene21300 [Stylophora pistillata]|uniref:Uncharacterized protein n=1 Tax=Stylophora pistillata TaxID=50429 RepID=A0A2B4RDI7_STYPI|nr:hypothetical protein AWC38_SpisGene21300 [Stylophora pistillata]
MWTQVWPIADLQRIDQETRKITVENGARHPLASTDQLYIPWSSGGRGLKSVESEYKLIKIKAAVKLCANTDPTLKLVREFEERAVEKGQRSMLKDASGFTRELGIELELEHPERVGRTEEGELVDKKKIGVFAMKALYTKHRQGIEEQRWQGKLVANRWQDDQLHRSCFSLLCEWRTAPTYTIAALEELYQQLLPTKVYSTRKANTICDSDVRCRLCEKGQESVAHVLAGCSALAQTAYLTRRNAAFKILFFELLRDHGLVNTVPPRYSPTQPKPIYEGEKVFKDQRMEQTDHTQQVAESILRFFPGFESFKLPPPYVDEEVMKNINRNRSQINSEFFSETEKFKVLFKSTLTPKRSCNDGELVTGQDIRKYHETALDQAIGQLEVITIGISSVTSEKYLNELMELMTEMQQYLGVLKQLKDFDENFSREIAATAYQQQEKIKLEEEYERLEQENRQHQKEVRHFEPVSVSDKLHTYPSLDQRQSNNNDLRLMSVKGGVGAQLLRH